MRHLTERLMQTVFLLVGFPLSGLSTTRRLLEISPIKPDGIPRLRARHLAACAHNTNWTWSPAIDRYAREFTLVNNTVPRPPRSLGRARLLLERSRLTRNGYMGGPTSNANPGGRSSSCW
jgi:hypothetical protein